MMKTREIAPSDLTYRERATIKFGFNETNMKPRLSQKFGMTCLPFTKGETWIESESFCTKVGQFSRRAVARHAITKTLVNCLATIPDTSVSIPAKTKEEYGYISYCEATNELVFHVETGEEIKPKQS